MRDQLMEPFSFFQMFSISLWLMDESRFYSLITLLMLVLSAFTVVVQRMKTLMMLNTMKLHPQYIQTFRKNKWVKLNSEELLPGDICVIQAGNSIRPIENEQSITNEQYLREQIPFSHKLPNNFFKQDKTTSDSYKTLPCDFLLLSGNCVVNESALTGESIPQIKDSIEKMDPGEIVDLKDKNRNSVLYCGTEVLQVYPNSNPVFQENVGQMQKLNCIGYVLNTGFDTSKGKLIKTVLFNNENVKIKQKDSYVIIFVLLIFSIVSSAYVLINGLKEESRNKNKLFLRCILIITTVVPPELPMILTISVNASLLYL